VRDCAAARNLAILREIALKIIERYKATKSQCACKA